MKALPALLALAGCNSIFGLNDNAKLGDAPIVFPDGELPTFKLRYLHAQTHVVPPEILGEPAPLERIGIDPAPRVRLGPVDGALVDAEYVVATGDIRIPIPLDTLLAAPWRVEYTIDGVIHEVIWQPETLTDAKLAESLLGRQDTSPPPAGSGYNIQPTGGAQPGVGMYTGSRVFTTGVFLDIRTDKFPSNTQLDGLATTFAGKLGTPDTALGDNAVLVNYAAPSAMCAAAVDGFGQFRPAALTTGTLTIVNPPWIEETPDGDLTVDVINEGAAGRVGVALGSRSDVAGTAIEHGITPSLELNPLLVDRPVAFGAVRAAVPGPMMLMLAQCNLVTTTTNFDAFLLPNQLDKFPRVTHGFITNRRTVSGVELVSGIVSVDDADAEKSTLDFGAPLAISPITLTFVDSTFGLDGADDAALIGPAPATLDFKLEPAQTEQPITIDYFEVTLFEIVDATLIPKRIITTTNTELTADRTLVTPIALDLTALPSGIYILRIRSIAGVPGAKQGNFETLALPYSAATVFTRTFMLL